MSFSRAKRKVGEPATKKRKSGRIETNSQLRTDGLKNLQGRGPVKGIKLGRRGSVIDTRKTRDSNISFVLERKVGSSTTTFKATINMTGPSTLFDKMHTQKWEKGEAQIIDNIVNNMGSKEDFGVKWKYKLRHAILKQIKDKKRPKLNDNDPTGDKLLEYLKKNGIDIEINVKMVLPKGKKIKNFKHTSKTPDKTWKKIFTPPKFQDELSAEQILGESLFLGLKF